jgi:putative flippase GtrA
VHNFFWHWKWTWADRRIPARAAPAAFARFALSNGAVSLVGTALAMPLLTGAGVKPLAANLGAIAGCGILNFCLASAVAFRWRATSHALRT